jgi:regulator of protease activity HflC (stomatin/prohibitin superfamily)
MYEDIIFGVVGLIALIILANLSLAQVRPKERGVVERLGKFNRVCQPGLVFLIPFVDKIMKVNITEQMVNAEQQEIITKDSLNAKVDAQVYFKVQSDDDSVYKSQYAVNDYEYQIVQLARTTLRNVIGNLSLTEANSRRDKLNDQLTSELRTQMKEWGIYVVRTELKEIEPPEDVQETMNKVVVAEKEKIAALDFATATETRADGDRRASIKTAEGERQAKILRAEGEAKAVVTVANAKAQEIKLVNDASRKYFVGNAQIFKRLEVANNVLQNNAKIIVPQGSDLVNVVDGAVGLVPYKKKD